MGKGHEEIISDKYVKERLTSLILKDMKIKAMRSLYNLCSFSCDRQKMMAGARCPQGDRKCPSALLASMNSGVTFREGSLTKNLSKAMYTFHPVRYVLTSPGLNQQLRIRTEHKLAL